MDAVETLKGRGVHTVTGKFDILGIILSDIGRADRFSESCKNVVASLLGVTGAFLNQYI